MAMLCHAHDPYTSPFSAADPASLPDFGAAPGACGLLDGGKLSLAGLSGGRTQRLARAGGTRAAARPASPAEHRSHHANQRTRHGGPGCRPSVRIEAPRRRTGGERRGPRCADERFLGFGPSRRFRTSGQPRHCRCRSRGSRFALCRCAHRRPYRRIPQHQGHRYRAQQVQGLVNAQNDIISGLDARLRN